MYLQVDGSRVSIVQQYVPVGATTVDVEDVSGFVVGDHIVVERNATAEWIAAIGTSLL